MSATYKAIQVIALGILQQVDLRVFIVLITGR